MPVTNPWLAGPAPTARSRISVLFGTARTLERDHPEADKC